jgi:hypothetical protein
LLVINIVASQLIGRRAATPRRAAEKRDEIASFQLIELHSVPASQGRIARYRIGEDQSGGNGTILQPVSRCAGDR